MDHNEYTLAFLIRQRHAEMLAQARAAAEVQRHRPRRTEVRVVVGAVLIRLGTWLLREDYVTS
jgi:hypothetical protein